MKNLFLSTLVGCVLMSSCSDDAHEFFTNESEKQTTVSNIRTVEEAIDIVSDNYGQLFNTSSSRSFNLKEADVIVLGSNRPSRSGVPDTVIYVVNFGDNSGFAVVTANKECTPLLAMTDTGEIHDIESIEIPGLKAFMNASIAYASGPNPNIDPIKPPTPDNEEPCKWFESIVTSTFINHKPRVKVTWNQSFPLGHYYSNGLCGCVVTAGMQALSYYELPKSINLTYPERDKGQETIDWSIFKISKEETTLNPDIIDGIGSTDNVPSLENYLALARFSREMGYKIKAKSLPETTESAASTTAYLSNLRNYMAKLVPSLEVSKINSGIPNVPKMIRWDIIIMGGKTDKNANVGHAWIVDGYKSRIDHYENYAIENPKFDIYGNVIITGEPYQVYDAVIYSMSHINWGWGGLSNGYYDVNVYDEAKIKERDNIYQPLDPKNFTYITEYFTLFKN